MHIAQLAIEGFRGVHRAVVPLGKNAVFVGVNNVGKTTLLEALALLFGRGRLAPKLSDHDFFGGTPTPASRIHIRAVLSGFPTEDPLDYPEIFHVSRAAPMYWDVAAGSLGPDEGPGRSLAVEIGACARFDFDELECEVLRYYVSGNADPFTEENLRAVSESVRSLPGIFYVPAPRTWEHALSFRADLFLKLLKYADALPADTIIALRDWLRNPPMQPQDEERSRELLATVEGELSRFFPGTTIRFMPTAGDVPSIMQSLHTLLPSKSGAFLPMALQGSGTIALQTLLLLMEFGRLRQARGDSFIILAEEPELHLHPGFHRRLVARLRGVANQTIITTHAPAVAAYHQATEIAVLHERDGHLSSLPLIRAGATIPDRNALLRLYTVYREEVCEALMHAIAVVPEGELEFRWLRSLTKESITAEGWGGGDLEGEYDSIGVIPTQNANVVQTYSQFREQVPVLVALVDGDDAGATYSRQLLALDHPPQAVVQLSDGSTLEHLIGWIICGDGGCPADISRILNIPDDSRRAEVVDALAGHAMKTRWDVHEEIAGWVGQNTESALRARRFLAGLRQVARGADPGASWINENMNLWRFAV